MKPALVALSNLPPPRIDIPGIPSPTGSAEQVILDGVGYRLTLNQLSFSTNLGSPLAEWTERTQAALAPCWRSEPPADMLPIDG